MVVKSQIKFIKSLQQKKYRTQNRRFVAEGTKIVLELLEAGFEYDHLYTTAKESLGSYALNAVEVTELELKKMSGLKTPNKVLGVFKIKEPIPLEFSDWIVALDAIKDPGNLGTIIRLCDWFGIPHLLCSRDTVDCYNPKVLRATMGSISRVNIVYEDLLTIIKNSELPVYGTYMGGISIYKSEFSTPGILLLGNESHGISQQLTNKTTHKIAIPQFGENSAESLNVAMAAGIMLSEIRRGK